jgi:putative ABC transport system ATP-binding protein
MMHRGQVVLDLRGAEKRRLRPEDLLQRFEELRRSDLVDPAVADMLRRRYV